MKALCKIIPVGPEQRAGAIAAGGFGTAAGTRGFGPRRRVGGGQWEAGRGRSRSREEGG